MGHFPGQKNDHLSELFCSNDLDITRNSKLKRKKHTNKALGQVNQSTISKKSMTFRVNM